MPHLEHVSVEGFKKIDRLAFDPGQFTVVTGRNNSGKTSLLEGINFGCDPRALLEYTRDRDDRFNRAPIDLSSYINQGHDASDVELKTGSDGVTVEFSLPSRSDRIEAVCQSGADLLERQFEGDRSLSQVISEQTTTQQQSQVSLEERLRRYVERTTTEGDLPVFEVIVDGESYTFFGGDFFSPPVISGFTMDVLAESMPKKVLSNLGVEVESQDQSVLKITTNYPRFTHPFPDSAPESNVRTRFIADFSLPHSSEDDNDPVRVDRVGDFLREKRVVDDLKTFTLDDLVFDPEDGEKYSIPFEQMGEGFKAIVGLLWELLDDDLPDVVFLEEPTTHMHPEYVREVVYFLIGLAMDEDIQLFVTTHSNDFLNDLFTETLTDEEVAFLEDEFQLVQMQDGGAKLLDYRQAEKSLTELYNDLRGL